MRVVTSTRNVTLENLKAKLHNETARTSGFMGFFIFKNMTLREFTKENNLNLDYKDRSKIGFRLKFLKSKFTYKEEYDYFVRDYEDVFFDRRDVQDIILNYMTNG